VIELDDASHLEAERQAKDEHLDAALSSAGVLLIRFPIYRRYDPPRIRSAVESALRLAKNPPRNPHAAE
jgi:very-short-patch-repair endonuclease